MRDPSLFRQLNRPKDSFSLDQLDILRSLSSLSPRKTKLAPIIPRYASNTATTLCNCRIAINFDPPRLGFFPSFIIGGPKRIDLNFRGRSILHQPKLNQTQNLTRPRHNTFE